MTARAVQSLTVCPWQPDRQRLAVARTFDVGADTTRARTPLPREANAEADQ